MTRKIPPWSQQHCDVCGELFLATRADPVELGLADELHCSTCVMYERGVSDAARSWRRALEEALGLEDDPEIHTLEWARETVRTLRELGNQS